MCNVPFHVPQVSKRQEGVTFKTAALPLVSMRNDWMKGAKFKKRVTWPWPRPMGAVCHPKLAFDIFYLRTKFDDSLASAVPEIWLRVSISTSSSAVTDEPERRTASQQMAKFYNSHVTTTTPLLWVICHPVARIDIAYLCIQFDDFRNNVATTLPLEVFTQRHFAADFFWLMSNFTGKNSKIAFLCHPLGELGATYTVHLWFVGKRVVDFLLVLLEYFSLDLTVEALWADIGRNCGVLRGRGVDHFERKFQGNGVSPTNDCGRQKTRVPGLSRGIACVILRLAVLEQYWRVTDRRTDGRTDRQTHDDGKYSAGIASCG